MRLGDPSKLLWAWALIPLLGLLIWGERRRLEALTRLFSDVNLRQVVPDFSSATRRLRIALLFVGIVLVYVALLRPQWGFRWVTQHDRGSDLIVVVDVSDSMRAGDLQPNRLERARRKLRDLLPLLKGERIGLVAFAGASHLLCPLTLDYEAFAIFLDYLDTSLIPVQGTDIGAALTTAMDGFEKNSPRRRSVLLITDGEDHEAGVDAVLERAESEKVKLFVVGIGAPEGAPIPAEESGGFRKDAQGGVIMTRLNEPFLKSLADKTGGRYARSQAGDLDLESVYLHGIRNEEHNGELKEQRQQLYTERYQWFLLPALLCFMLTYLLRERRRNQSTTGRVAASILFLVIAGNADAGPLKRGTEAYERKEYPKSLQNFTESQVENPEEPRIHYNLGNNYYRLEQFDAAAAEFDKAAKGELQQLPEAEQRAFRQDALYNQGNALFRKQDYQGAVKSYEEALKLKNDDKEAQHNLELAKKMLEQQQQDKKDQQNNKDKKKDPQQKDSDQKSAQSDQNQQQQQQKGDSDKEQSANKDQGQQPSGEQPSQMSPEEAKRWLSSVQENGKQALEQALQMKFRKRAQPDKDW